MMMDVSKGIYGSHTPPPPLILPKFNETVIGI